MFIGKLPGMSIGVSTVLDGNSNELIVFDLSSVSLIMSLLSMLRMFIAAFEISVFDEEERSAKKDLLSVLEWGHLIIVSSYSRILGMILIFAYPEIGFQHLRWGILAVWILGSFVIAYRYKPDKKVSNF